MGHVARLVSRPLASMVTIKKAGACRLAWSLEAGKDSHRNDTTMINVCRFENLGAVASLLLIVTKYTNCIPTEQNTAYA